MSADSIIKIMILVCTVNSLLTVIALDLFKILEDRNRIRTYTLLRILSCVPIGNITFIVLSIIEIFLANRERKHNERRTE